MARYKPQDRNSLLLPVVLSEQIVPGSFAFALDYLVDNELDLSALDAQFRNDEVGASAYDPRVMLKIVLLMASTGRIHTLASGLHYQTYTATEVDCKACTLSKPCLKGPLKPNDGRGRKVTRFEPKTRDPAHPSERMRQAIASPRGRQLYSQRIGTVEPVFGNIRHNKRLARLNHRGRAKVNTQWNLYCMVHNIEKLANNGYAQ